jgi:chromosome segregation ATPase
MADGPTLHELAAYGTSGLALLVASWKRLQRRDDDHEKAEEKRRNEQHQALLDAIKELRGEMREQISELSREIRHLRETDIRQATEIGNLQSGLAALEKRVNGQAVAHREELDRIAPRKLRTE